MGIFDRFRKKKARAQKTEPTPEKKQLEAYALVGKNVLDQGPWEWKPDLPEENRLGNLVLWSLRTPFSGEPMVIDRVNKYIYCGRSHYRFDLEGNPKGLLRLGEGELRLAISHDGQVLVSRGSWMYKVDTEGQVISAVQSGWFNSIDVLPEDTIVGVRHYRERGIEKTILGFVQGEKVHEVDVSAIMVYGRSVRSSADGLLYVVGGPAYTTFVGNTVFKFDPTGHLVNSSSIFKNIGAICPTHDGGIDVLEIDGSRLVRLSREMKVVYDSQRDSRPEAVLLFQTKRRGFTLLYGAKAMDVDDAGNCYVSAYSGLKRFRRFWG
jgi:hypothetical protein